MKKTIYVLLAALLIVSCSKNEETILRGLQYEQLKKFDLQKKFDDIDKVSISELNDSLIFFGGRLKNSSKISLSIYNSNTKIKLFEITPFESDKLTTDIPYQGKTEWPINYIRLDGFAKNKNAFVIGIVVSKNKLLTSSPNELAQSNLIFINNGEVIKSIKLDSWSYYGNIINWGENFIFNQLLYKPSGEVLAELKYDINLMAHLVVTLNDYEAILINSFTISKIDLREKNPLWTSNIDTNNFNDPRFDGVNLVSNTTDYLSFEIHFTEYSGTKNSIKFKINTSNGDIKYL